MSRLLTLAAAFCAGVAAHRWLQRQGRAPVLVLEVGGVVDDVELTKQPPHVEAEPGRVAQVLCRCVRCSRPFPQETPPEVQ